MRHLKIGLTITGRDSASLDKYLMDISKIPLLTAEEEILLSRKIKAGDELAYHHLVNANLRFVVSVAKQYQHRGLVLGDLINEGNIGLIKAAGRFDDTLGFKFISFAVWWIRQTIMQALAEQTRVVRLPLNQVAAISRINKAIAKLEHRFERHPTVAEISEFIGIGTEFIQDYLSHAGLSVSLDSPTQGLTDHSLGEYLEGDLAMPDEGMVQNSAFQEVDHLIKTLPKRQAHIIRLYYGIGTEEPKQLHDIAEIYGLSKERVRQIKDQALKELKRRGSPYFVKLGIIRPQTN